MIKEHFPLITGKGTYIDDINPKNVAYLHIVRSPIARGIIKSISRPESALLSFTWEDVKTYVPAWGTFKNAQVVKMPVLADGRVSFVGQPVLAFVVDDRYKTEDVAEEVSIDYEELDPVVDPEEALNREPIHPGLKGNVSVDELLQGGDLSLKDKADVVVSRKIKQNRIVANPIETRGVICWWDGDVLNVYVGTQSPFYIKNGLREALGIPPENIKVYSPPNVGGAFGNKTNVISEYILSALASKKLNRPVKWIETRSEHLVNNMSHGRGVVSDMKLYATKDGEILGVEGTIIVNLGAYNTFAILSNKPRFIATLITGPYKMKFASVRALGVFTNTPPMGFYRGAGRPEAALIHETLVEDLADELGMDPVEIRRKNLVDDNGYITPLGNKLDPAGYREVLDEAEKYYRKAKEVYKDKGVAIVTFTEIARLSFGESAKARIKDSKVYFYLGLGPHGQAYASTFSKLASEVLGISEDKIEVITGSTEIVKEGFGSFGARGGTVGGSAVIVAAKELLNKIGKSTLTEEDLRKFEGVEVEVFYKPDDIFAPGAHVAVVDVDETGKIKVIEYYAVDDVGRVLNLEEVEGQIVGGVLQGLSQVTLEEMRYDEWGNPLCTSIADCGVPTALEAPLRVETKTLEFPSQLPSKSRGVGEAGTIGALPAVFIAVEKKTKKKFNQTPINPWLMVS